MDAQKLRRKAPKQLGVALEGGNRHRRHAKAVRKERNALLAEVKILFFENGKCRN